VVGVTQMESGLQRRIVEHLAGSVKFVRIGTGSIHRPTSGSSADVEKQALSCLRIDCDKQHLLSCPKQTKKDQEIVHKL
jgi:hypothetical protein